MNVTAAVAVRPREPLDIRALELPGLRLSEIRTQTTPPIGRSEELGLIRSFVGEAAVRGGVLLLSGAPGVGKTVLLDVAAEAASAAGARVVRAAGVEFEAEVSFSGLNQILLPLRSEFGRLGVLHRDALTVALGLDDGSPADILVVSNVALALLRESAADCPLLLIVDDAEWLDRASAMVLGLAARRLTDSRVGFLAAARSGAESFFEYAGLPVHELQPLCEEAAASLVRSRFPGLAPRVSQRLLAEAHGNPLALLELPGELSGPQLAATRVPPTVLPLSRRLQAPFASRIADLPDCARYLLLLAVLDGTGDLLALQRAAAGQADLIDLAPAEIRKLVYVHDGRLAFRHPLTRSAVFDLSTSHERRQAHLALAELTTDRPERRAWHLAEAAVGPDENVANLLEQVALKVLWATDTAGAVAALLRSAELSPQGRSRSVRLAEAAYTGAMVTGDLCSVPQLLADARRADPRFSRTLENAVVASYLMLNVDGDVDAAHRLLATAMEDWDQPHHASNIEALYTLLLVCSVGGRPELWESFDVSLARLQPQVPAVLAVLSKIVADPARTAVPALGRLDTAISRLHEEVNPAKIVRIGIAAGYADRLADCREPLWRVVRDGRSGGAITSAMDALMLLAYDSFAIGRWHEAQQLADEGLGLCEAHGYQLMTWQGRYCQALLAATRGDYDQVLALTAEMTRWAVPRTAELVKHYCYHAAELAALGQGDFAEAYRLAAAISPAGVLASHAPLALRVGMDLVEAAVRTGRHAQAAAHVAAMCAAGIATISPRMALLVGGAAAITAPDDSAARLFDEALGIPDAERWPFDFARVQLAYGSRLRRARATTAARSHLSSALEAFERLGARPWATRAEGELRATGLGTPRTHTVGAASLTPRERQIAQLAAAGLTNKQIGERLSLTHRTVGVYLYQIFPKLGITSRAALHAALASFSPNPPLGHATSEPAGGSRSRTKTAMADR